MTKSASSTTTTSGNSNVVVVVPANNNSRHHQNIIGFDELFRRREEKKNKVSMIAKTQGVEVTPPSLQSRHRVGGRGKAKQRKSGNGAATSHSTRNTTAANNNHNSSPYFLDLERRARSHAQAFPSPAATSADCSQLLASWNRTTFEIIMLMSKLWGKDSRWHFQSTSEVERQQLCRMVSLADELLVRLLSMKKIEINDIIARMKEYSSHDEHACNNSTSSARAIPPLQYHPTRRNNDNRIVKDPQKTLNTEILCSTVALGWSRCDPTIATDASRKAEAILESLEDICSQLLQMDGCSRALLGFDTRDVTPSIKLYNHVLSCWSRSSDPIAEWRAKVLLERMISSCSSSADGRHTAFSRPDTFSYNNILNLYANRGDAQSAEAMLLQMENMNDDYDDSGGGASADVYSYSIVINAFQKRFVSSGPRGGGGDRKDLERAEELLSTLATKYEQSGFRNTRLRPTNVTFGTIISMYAQADRLARRVITPDGELDGHKTRKWKAAMLTRANIVEGNDVGWGAVNAERVLNWMIGLSERERLSKNGDSSSSTTTSAKDHRGMICPNTHNFATVMDAWAKAGKGVEGARRCQALLDRLVSLYEKWDTYELRPIPLVRRFRD